MKKFIVLITLLLMAIFNYESVAQVITSQEEMAAKDTLAANLMKAQSLADQGNMEEALKIYIRLIETYPDDKAAVQGWIITKARIAQGGPEEMLKSLEQLQEMFPMNSGILFWKAFMEASMDQNEAALIDLNELIKIQPDTALHYIIKAQVLGAMEEYGEAIEALERATSLDPTRPDVWGMKAGALAKVGKFDDALTAMNKGLELAPNEPVNIYNRACIYCLKGDKVNALADLEKAISLNPSLKQQAPRDEDFKGLYDDEEFKKLTLQ
jgi:tetratricopeptide (TPR) repeat protein